MIVRILAEGQYRLADAQLEGELTALDDRLIDSVETGDKTGFRRALDQMLELVDSNGTPLAEDELVASDIVLPPRDVSFEEARREFRGEGLVPD